MFDRIAARLGYTKFYGQAGEGVSGSGGGGAPTAPPWVRNLAGFGSYNSYKIPDPVRRLAAQVPTVQRSTSLIATSCAGLRLQLVQDGEPPKAEGEGGGREPRNVSSLRTLLAGRPDGIRTRVEWVEQCLLDLLYTGNCFIRKHREAGSLVRLELLDPCSVDIMQMPDGGLTYQSEDGSFAELTSYELTHIRLGNHTPRRIHTNRARINVDHIHRGTSPMSSLLATLHISLYAADYVKKFFHQGLTASLAFIFEEKLSERQQEDLKAYINEVAQGTANSRKPFIFHGEKGAKFEKINLTPQDAELLQTRLFTVEEISRALGVPASMLNIGAHASGRGIGGNSQDMEQLMAMFMNFTLLPLCNNFETALSADLLGEGWQLVFDIDGFVRADAKSRADYFARALGGSAGPGWMTRNEVRRREGLPPLEGDENDNIPKWFGTGGKPGAGSEEPESE